jgi:hypothetical protein
MRFGGTFHGNITLCSKQVSDLRHLTPFLGSAAELQLKFGLQVI